MKKYIKLIIRPTEFSRDIAKLIEYSDFDIFTGEDLYYNYFKPNRWGRIRIMTAFKELLETANWKYDLDKYYLAWHYHTNPADPADSGEDILQYLVEVVDVKGLKDYLYHLCIDQYNGMRIRSLWNEARKSYRLSKMIDINKI